MFMVVQRADHVVAVMPVADGVRTKLYLSNDDTCEIALPFARVSAGFRQEIEPGA